MSFINHELQGCGYPVYEWDRVIDTLEIARQKFPHSKVNLDALCKRFGVDNTSRTLHGALLDAQLLAEVYLELLGGQEPSMQLGENAHRDSIAAKTVSVLFNHSRGNLDLPEIFRFLPKIWLHMKIL